MKNFIEFKTKLYVTQTVVTRIIKEMNDNIEAMRDDMGDDFEEAIDAIIDDDKELLSKRGKKMIFTYLDRALVGMDNWHCAKTFIRLATLNAYQYGESGLALPKNKKILSILLPKLTEKFGITFEEMEMDNLSRILDRETNWPPWHRKSWICYKLTTKK